MVKYEWTKELIDEGGDIVDSDFADSLKDFQLKDTERYDLGLVRNEGSERAGVTGRLWAYVVNNKLPEYFSEADGNQTTIKVPAKYHNELKNHL